jgi:hypothetical protein
MRMTEMAGMLTPDNIPLFGGYLKALPHLIVILGVVIFAVLAKHMDREKPRRD